VSSQGIPRRAVLKYTGVMTLGALGAADIVPGCARGAHAANILNVATVGGTWKDWQNECTAQPFTKQTGVSLVWDVQTPVSIATQMVAAKKGNRIPPNQVSKADQFDIQFFDQQGLTSKVDVELAPTWKDIHPNFRSESWMTNHVAVYCMTWNKEKVKKPITSWFDMWDDVFRGKVAIPVFEWVGFYYLAALNTALGGSPENADRAFGKLKELVDTLQPKFMNSVEHGNQLFQAGEIWIAPFWDGRTRNLQDQGLPVAYVYPKEGALSNASGFCLDRAIADDRVKAANQFMNQVGVAENQICFASKINYPPTNLRALGMLPPKLERIKISQADLDRMLRVPWTAYNQYKGDYLARWNKEIAKV